MSTNIILENLISNAIININTIELENLNLNYTL